MKENPYIVIGQEGKKTISPAGREYLKRIVTDHSGPVYAFTEEANPMLVSAALARLSRSRNDLRITYLDEFAANENASDIFIEKVVADFGDDSVKQLNYLFLVVENASNLMTKRLERGRFAGYLEQSTRYVYFDQKDENGEYRYFVPQNFDLTTSLIYKSHMDFIFCAYSDVVRKLTEFIRKIFKEPYGKEERSAWLSSTRAQACDAARAMLPVAAQSAVGIVATAQAVENMIYYLYADTLAESLHTANSILREAKKVIGPFLRQVERQERGGAAINYRKNTQKAIKEAVREIYKQRRSAVFGEKAVELVDWWPKGNELNILVPEMLFSETMMPIKMLKKNVRGWPHEQKLEIFNAYVGNRLNYRHKPGRAFEAIHYEWELFIDYGIFRDLQRHRVLDMPEWQALTPDYGYEVPELIKNACLEDEFKKCFEVSKKLHTRMKNMGHEEEAQYATLLGHKMRFRFVENAREAFHLHELRTKQEGHPGYREIVKKMHRLLSEKHPFTGSAMKFVDNSENPKLARLSAELAKEKKIATLEKSK